MAKKRKVNMINSVMTSVINNEVDDVNNKTVLLEQTKEQVEATEEKITAVDIAIAQLDIKQEEIKYDDCCDGSDELTKLSEENSILIDKIDEYITEIRELNIKNQSIQKEYDNCLIKISELSFEIANLKTGNQLNNLVQQSSKIYNQDESLINKLPFKNRHGYIDWN